MSPSLDLGRLGHVLQAMVERDGRPLLLRDEASGRLHRLPTDLAAAPDGVMPSMLAAAEAVWQVATDRALGVEQVRDPAALLGYRVQAVRGEPLTVVALAALEAIRRTPDPAALLVNDFAEVWRSLRLEQSPVRRASPGASP